MIGLDTETVQGKAWLVCTSDPRRVWFGPGGSSAGLWEKLLAWDTEYVTYNLTYDAQALLLHTSPETIWRLERIGKAIFRGLQISWIRGKRLTITAGSQEITLYDCAQYYHCSLDSAAEKHLGERKQILPPEIDVTNLAPAFESSRQRTIVEDYCRRDAWLCERLYQKIECGLAKLGVAGKPISAAYLAGKYFLGGRRGAGERQNRIAEPAYYGGRIEMFARGLYAGPVWAYDIRSAYPTQAAQLYDPRSLRLKTGPVEHPEAKLGLYHVAVEQPLENEHGLLPCRKAGMMLTYPVGNFREWIDRNTLHMLQRRAHRVEVLEAIEWLGTYRKPGVKLFPQIPTLYKAREDPVLKQAVKLLLNGLYGKLAQIDERWVEVTDPALATLEENGIYLARVESEGPYRDLMLAAHITGGARAQLTEALLDGPRNSVLMCATDSIYSLVERPDLPLGNHLGQWSVEHYHAWLGIMTGVYATKSPDGSWHSMSRGFATKQNLPAILAEARPGAGQVQIRCKVPLTALWALKQGKQVNDIATWDRTLMLNADRKRFWRTRTDAQRLMRGLEWSEPLILEGNEHE